MSHNKSITAAEARLLGLSQVLQIESCGKNYRGKALYVLEFDTGIKIGASRNLCYSLKDYQKPWIHILRASCFKTVDPIRLETKLKREFRSFTKEEDEDAGYLRGVSYEVVIDFIMKDEFYYAPKLYFCVTTFTK